jgi:thiamine pyrophosphokinase
MAYRNMTLNPQVLVFLGGAYFPDQTQFYLELVNQLPRPSVVAVDGSLAFLHKLNIRPDWIIGDMDSVDAQILKHYRDVPVLRLAQQKDMTDGEGAMREAIRSGAKEITVLGALDDRLETDHMLGNVFLIAALYEEWRGQGIRITIADPGQSMYFVLNEKRTIQGQSGDGFSLVPLSETVELTYTGLAYPLDRTVIPFGSTRTLRNTFASRIITIEVKGKALAIHHFSNKML